MVRVGIVGMGFMGSMHFACYQKIAGAKVVAIADADPKRAAGNMGDVNRNLGDGGSSQLPMEGITSTTDWRELLKMDLDVVDVCVPTPSHHQVTIAALRADKHVVCEKPLARTLELAHSIADATRATKRFFMPAMCIRFWPEWAWLKQALVEKSYGKLLSVSLCRLASMPLTPWYARGGESGGALLDLHIHDTDFICWLLGSPKAVKSCGYSRTSGEVDHLLTQYIYDDVPLVTAEGGFCLQAGFPFRMRYLANFEEATVDYDLARPEPLILYQSGKGAPITCAKSDGWLEELRYFVTCVASDARPTVVTVDDAILALRVIEAEKQSIAHGGAVQI